MGFFRHVAGSLDRERSAIYELTIEARETSGTNTATTTLTIDIVDENDNPPECVQNQLV